MALADDPIPPMRKTHQAGVKNMLDRVHAAAVCDIADDVNLPLAEIRALYWDLLVELSAHAKVTDYLPVLVARRIRERHRTPPA